MLSGFKGWAVEAKGRIKELEEKLEKYREEEK